MFLRIAPRFAVIVAVACHTDGTPEAPPIPAVPQIVFGDLHVHSTNSMDVYVLNVPLLGGRGEVSPGDHCQFARHCSRLDFWAITDHQEGAPPTAWDESKAAVRACNAQYGGYDQNPSMVSFAGFEWQQSAEDPAGDWGHKNVLFRDDGENQIPKRAIASKGQVTGVTQTDVDLAVALATSVDPDNAAVYAALDAEVTAGLTAPQCADGVASPSLPLGCVESAEDPHTLYGKLDEWGYDALVIPHGYTWGAHHGPLTSWEHQLDPVQHDPNYQTLVEMYSGHGSMEEYRTWVPVAEDPAGAQTCPAATPDYLPCCWRAGELVAAGDPGCVADPDGVDCQTVVEASRQAFVDAGRDGFATVSGADPADWLDCGECRDCFQPAEGHRPLGSSQAALARTAFDENGDSLRYQWGFIGSTDTHAVGPGAGFKEDKWMSDVFGSADPDFDVLVDLMVPQLFPDWVRQNSYYYSGGLVAAHSVGRSREATWAALKRREVYATSGERILLWFDLLNGPEGSLPMGSSATLAVAPQFEVRAIGSFIQAPGCPADLIAAAPDGLIEGTCFGECYNPTDERYLIERLELVRITPQISSNEPLVGLITDPLAVHVCPPNPDGCTWTFEDLEWPVLDRPALYYVRAIQEPSAQLNADGVRCTWDDQGQCVATNLCPSGWAGEGDDCLGQDSERAWASPIYLSALSLLFACDSRPPLGADVVADVSGQKIAADRYYEALAALAVQERAADLTPAHRQRVLDELIDDALLRERAVTLGLHPMDAADPGRAALDVAVGPLPLPTESDLRAYYVAHPQAFAREPAFQVEALRFTGPQASGDAQAAAAAWAAGRPVDAARLEVPSGPLPFAALEQRIGPSAARAARSMVPGEVSAATPYASGWLVIRLVATMPGEPAPFEAVRPAVEALAVAEAKKQARERFLDALRDQADITTNAAVRDAPIPLIELENAARRESRGAGR